MTDDETTCPHCERTYHKHLDDMRFRLGRFVTTVGGKRVVYDRLCEDCHRALVRS